MPVNYVGEGHLTGLVLSPGQEGQRGRRGRPAVLRDVLREGRAGAKLPLVSFSLYCPKDNIEEALLLLLISESMVSSRAGPAFVGGASALRHWPPGPS